MLFPLSLFSQEFVEKKLIQNDLPCRIIRGLPDNLDSLKFSVKDWITGSEVCVMNLIDSIADIYTENGDFRALSCLMAVCNNADGKIADYMVDINGSIFYSRFDIFVKYLYYYKQNFKDNHCFVKYLVSALSLQIAAGTDQAKERDIILKHINTESKKAKLSEEEKNYILEIYSKANPDLWK